MRKSLRAVLIAGSICAGHSGAGYGQASADVPVCKPSEIDVTFEFGDVPVGHQTVSIILRNTSGHACFVSGKPEPWFNGPPEGTFRQTKPVEIKTCWRCVADPWIATDPAIRPTIKGGAGVSHFCWTRRSRHISI